MISVSWCTVPPRRMWRSTLFIKDETVWLTPKAMAELFSCTSDNISLLLKNIFAEGELNKEAVTEKISATVSDGKRYLTQFYNLDAIISVGYRVNFRRAIHFRIWATGGENFPLCQGVSKQNQYTNNAESGVSA